MKTLQWLRQFLIPHLERLNHRLANPDALSVLAFLGVLIGLVAGAVMVAFRLLVEWSQTTLLNLGNPQDYEHLSLLWRLLLPTAGGLLIGLWFQQLSMASRQVGVIHVMHSLSHRDGMLPLRNAGIQFFSAAICLISGHSVGREGPSIHIGATCGSWMGQELRLPDNSIRVLVGCGTAGAIAAAFNTPLAGVIFTMEVVMAEYTLASFIPIILAAVSATSLSRWVFGDQAVFVTPEVMLGSLNELFYIVAMGIVIGALSAIFIRLLLACSKLLLTQPLWCRLTLAGAATGVLALPIPEVMGIGYDTVNAALLGKLSLELMLAVLCAKLVATAWGIGLGLPGGIIGPTLFMGAVAGGVMGLSLHDYFSADISPALYAMLGMGAMMGATLNAPLAALTALLELTHNPHIIWPGMLAIVAAGLVSGQLFGHASIFVHMLQMRGLMSPAIDPVSQFLRRLGVSMSMDRRVRQLTSPLDRQQFDQLLDNPPTWLLLRQARPRPQLIFTADLIRWQEDSSPASDIDDENNTEQHIDLLSISIPRRDIAPVSARATLLGALRKMNDKNLDALYVVSVHSGRVLGIITRQAIERSYRNPMN